jgi:hypothetical protein
MGTLPRRFATLCMVVALLAMSALAKRLPPVPVPPVMSGGISYSAGGHGRDQYVIAADTSSGNELWRIKVFHNYIRPWLEEDVQWVFITDLKLVDHSILVRDEKSRCYSVDLSSRHVKKKKCGDELPQR